ncbi:antibiotic biosynthesis monooxygenase [Acidovorax sp.]|uniref:antibiotic biosynthesis monooxygenase family protein n=1 Tax=Acidovorax sp. TaxID=1872122 RepID=UPI0025BEEDE6|nr:antibiotic biosynthesis monooxygenase [Acidovorax sp.]MBL7090941.1 antibiotic biosynthesis monooxygenase [Acidovorax sp.]
MYSSTFIFATKQLDDAFHRLDEAIATAARSIDGYLGEESWTDTGNGLVSNVYYWQSLEALQTLMKHPAHLKAKAAQAQWLNGYQVVIAQVLRTYGDNQLTGLLPTAGLFTQGTAPH